MSEEQEPIPMDKVNEEAKKIATPQEPEKQEQYFKADFAENDVLTLTLDLKAAVVNNDHAHMLRGFVMNTLDQAMGLISVRRKQIEGQKQEILKLQAKNGRINLLDKVFRK